MNHITILRAFRATVEHASVVRAGRSIGLEPRFVSVAISSLERRLSLLLFRRSMGRVLLTETGEIFYIGCCRILDELDRLDTAVV